MKTITIGDKDYNIEYTFNSMCEMEEKTSKSITTFETMSFSTVRAFLWAGLLELNHSISLTQAGKLVETWCKASNKSYMDLGGELIEIATQSGFFGEALMKSNQTTAAQA
jgi:endonuclease I